MASLSMVPDRGACLALLQEQHTPAHIQRHCIAVAEEQLPEMRLLCSKAADELLNIENVDASFVVYENNGAVNISARSFGKLNVQVIMEKLGGGGHQTMAAAQLVGVTLQEAKEKLIEVLDEALE